MSRIGKAPISIPEGVTVDVADGNVVTVKGKLGELTQKVNADMKISVNDGELVIERPSESKEHKSHHGLSRALINNMVVGVSEGFVIEQELVGVGFRAKSSGQTTGRKAAFSREL